MKRILIILYFLISLCAIGQEPKPIKTIKVIQSPLFYRAPIDSSIYLYGNDGRGGMWNRITTLKTLGYSLKWYVPYDGAFKDLHMNKHSISTSSLILNKDNTPSILGEGQMYWDSITQSIVVQGKDTATHLNIGEEVWIPLCYNNSGVDILNGKPVYINSSYNGYPTITLASNITYTESRLIGVATEDIPNGKIGRVTRFGYVNDINLSSCTPGTSIYLGDKVLTSVRPTNGLFPVIVGKSIVCSIHGKLLVYPQTEEYTAEVNKVDGWPSYLQGEQTNLSFVDATRTAIITPVGSSYYFYQGGIKYIKYTSESFQITDVEGLHYIYYDLGILYELVNPSASQLLDLMHNKVSVGVVYWDYTNKVYLYGGNERHTFHWPFWVRSFIHTSFWTQYLTGLGVTNVTLGSGTSNADAQFGVDSGSIADEDIITTTDAITSTTGLPIFYRRLDKSALEYSRQIELAVLYDTRDKIEFTNLINPYLPIDYPMHTYQNLYSDRFGEYPDFKLIIKIDNFTEWTKLMEPIRYYIDGKLDHIVYELDGDPLDGAIIISR